MEVYGYDKNDNGYNEVLKLKEITLYGNENDLDKMIEFLKNVRDEIAEMDIEEIGEGEHWHYRDYNEQWTEQESDLIFYFDK